MSGALATTTLHSPRPDTYDSRYAKHSAIRRTTMTPVLMATPTRGQPPARVFGGGDGSDQPDVSVILPCYRSARLALQSVETLRHFLSCGAQSWEIIVVDDGGGDFAEGALPDAGPIRLVRLPVNRGKGAAVAAGMRAARGRVRVFTDVDLPYDLDLIPAISEYILHRGFHMVVGDRTLPTSRYSADIGWRRRIASAGFSAFVGKLVTGGFFDTQCGLKGFRGDVADTVFGLTRLERFTFDVELIYLALVYRIDIKRIPVQLRHNETSSVRLLRDAARAVMDIFRIKYYQLTGVYRSSELTAIITDDFVRTRTAVAGQMQPHAVGIPGGFRP